MKCQYGCENDAKYILKNGKHCCCETQHKCPTMRQKTRIGVQKAYQDGILKGHPIKNSGWSKGKTCLSDNRLGKIPIEKIFVENSLMAPTNIKKLVQQENLKDYRCEKCGNNGYWQNEKLVLELDHINGIRHDNRLENIRFLCPNCHSQTMNFKGKNMGNGGTKFSEEEIIQAIKICKNNRQVLLKVGMNPTGANYNRLYKIMAQKNLQFNISNSNEHI